MSELDDLSPASSPLSLSATASKEDALAYYKLQYEQLESELADFQTSSRELEVELERDIEAAEKRERQLQEKVESLGFEVDEWKSKYKQSKTEANSAQNTLQKEITTLRDSNRTLQLKLRDIEVANDDFERQARNTSSSLEDIESKYNAAIERGVIFEEEIKNGEQERESLRIEAQRLREELADLKVEAEIRQDKLRHAEAAQRRSLRKPTPIGASFPRPQSSISEHSPTTSESSPTAATPPTKSISSATSDAPTPPSPPVSEKSLPTTAVTPAASKVKPRQSITNSATPRPSHFSSRAPRHSKGPSLPVANAFITPSVSRRTTGAHTDGRKSQQGLPPSASLTQIRGLIGKMQKLEQRVQSARSKLPGPVATPPRASPRPGSALSQSNIPNTVTVRSQRKRTGGSIASGVSSIPSTERTSEGQTTLKPSSRRSFGLPQPTPTKDIPKFGGSMSSRPSSRASLSSRQSLSNLPSIQPSSTASSSRPTSRQSMTGARTPLGHYASSSVSERSRPRSSIAGSYIASHGHSQSVSRQSNSRLSNYGEDESPETGDITTPTPNRRTTFGTDSTGIPLPPSLSRRQSGAGAGLTGGKTSSGTGLGDMGPPTDKRTTIKKLSELGEVGETY